MWQIFRRPVKPASVPDQRTFLPASRNVARWGVLRIAMAARAAPSPGAGTLARLETRTPERT